MAHDERLFRPDVSIKCQIVTIATENRDLVQGFQRAAKDAIERGLIPADDHMIKQLLRITENHPDHMIPRSLPQGIPAPPTGGFIRRAKPTTRPGVVPFDPNRRKR